MLRRGLLEPAVRFSHGHVAGVQFLRPPQGVDRAGPIAVPQARLAQETVVLDGGRRVDGGTRKAHRLARITSGLQARDGQPGANLVVAGSQFDRLAERPLGGLPPLEAGVKPAGRQPVLGVLRLNALEFLGDANRILQRALLRERDHKQLAAFEVRAIGRRGLAPIGDRLSPIAARLVNARGREVRVGQAPLDGTLVPVVAALGYGHGALLLFAPAELDALFRRTAVAQYERELLFSTLVDLTSLVVCRISKSVHAAYVRKREEVGVSIRALYDKLDHLEIGTSRALVQYTAGRVGELIRLVRGPRASLLKGYKVRILDGNHLGGTHHRLKVLRRTAAGALPGQALALLDPQRMLIVTHSDQLANQSTRAARMSGMGENRDIRKPTPFVIASHRGV